jgi:cyclophilin family peptidyl-prolyl cis-trans isomerase
MATIKTNHGDIKLELDEKNAPITVANFLEYARSGHYAGTIFHRVIETFMIQGGGLDKDLNNVKTRAPIKNESTNGLSNKKYTVAMARTNVPDSATSQFFINTSDNDFLDRANASDGVGYAVFGRVIEGQDIVDKIAKVKTTTRSPHANVPVDTIEILAVEID